MFSTLKAKSPQSDDIPFEDLGKAASTNLPVLHIDIIYHILEHAYFNDYLRPDYKQLCSYALVARAWRKPAQGLIFHEVVIKTDAAYKALSSIFKGKQSEYTQKLASCVRVLNFWISKTDKASAAKWESRLAPILNWFPSLYELRLGVDVLDRLSPATMSALNNTPPIRALQIAMRSDETGRQAAQSVLPFQILGVTAWKLEFLVMRGDVFRFTGYTEFPAVTHQLVEFRWSINSPAPNAGVDDAITYVTANSLKTLEVLHVPSGTHPVVSKVVPTLHSLKVISRDGIPKKLKNLKELIIADSGDLPTDVAFYEALPPHIVHLGILSSKPDYSATHQAMAIGLDHKLPSKLQILSVYHDKTGYAPPTFKNEEFVLKGSGVLVRYHTGKESAMIAMRSDLVKSTVYPRGVSVENMRLMGRIGGTGETRAPPTKSSIFSKIL
ncbi:hypothetical protein M408DRAFT_326888 [Serendipita vermifera MAFF 305830]|uniref:Uncharacterized protein n=1 Tax=Serendipita vermifera MAFF 305830 TaxID=933852 RepID=A0A0C3B602_SERVB|nr:hypothetical protein M408DRAFT_326888 [Serendipita vermifera MAFF 305830]